MEKGIDYGNGKVNIDLTTGIRFGVISSSDLLQTWTDESEAYYGDPTCPKCGEVANTIDLAMENYEKLPGWEINGIGYVCHDCKYAFNSEEAYGDEPISWTLNVEEYEAEQGDDGNIFVTKSPYYTLAAFCSPCAPGACHLRSPIGIGLKAYCFGHDWFDDNIAPYPIFCVDDNSYVAPGKKKENDNG